VTVRAVEVAVTVGCLLGAVVSVVGLGGRRFGWGMRVPGGGIRVAGTLDPATRKSDIDLYRPDARTAHAPDVDFDLGNAETGWETLEPALGRAGSNQGAQEHVPADPRSRVEDGKPAL
jgi:hypothetical protein